MSRYKTGWFGDNHRHYLAAKYGAAPKSYFAMSTDAEKEAAIRRIMRAEGVSKYEAEYVLNEAMKKQQPGTFIERPKPKPFSPDKEDLSSKFSKWKSARVVPVAKTVPVTPVQVVPVVAPESNIKVRVQTADPADNYVHIHPEVIQELQERIGSKFSYGYSPASIKEKAYSLQRKLGLPQSDTLDVGEVMSALHNRSKGDVLNMMDELQVAAPAIAREMKKQLGTSFYEVKLNPVTGMKEYHPTSQQPVMGGAQPNIVTYSPDYTGQGKLDEYNRKYAQLENLRKYGGYLEQKGGSQFKTALQMKIQNLENELKIIGKDVGAVAETFPAQFPTVAAYGKEAGKVASLTAQRVAAATKEAAAKGKAEILVLEGKAKHALAEPYISLQLRRQQAERDRVEALRSEFNKRLSAVGALSPTQAYEETKRLQKLRQKINVAKAGVGEEETKLIGFAEEQEIPLKERLSWVTRMQSIQSAKQEAAQQQAAAAASRARQERLIQDLSPEYQSVLRKRNLIGEDVRTIPELGVPKSSSLLSALERAGAGSSYMARKVPK